MTGEFERNPTPALPFAGEGVSSGGNNHRGELPHTSANGDGVSSDGNNETGDITPPPAKGEAGRGSKHETVIIVTGELERNPTPTLPFAGEGVSSSGNNHRGELPHASANGDGVSSDGNDETRDITPPPAKGEAGRGSKRKRINNLTYQKHNRRQLRANRTQPEKLFWSWVRSKQLGTKFRRQQSIDKYIVDFYNAEYRLVIELDGDSHFNPEAEHYDKERDHFLESKGLNILRFTNQDIMQNKEGVLMRVNRYLTLTPSQPSPSQGEE